MLLSTANWELSTLGAHQFQLRRVRHHPQQWYFSTTEAAPEALRAAVAEGIAALLGIHEETPAWQTHRRELGRWLRGIPAASGSHVVAISDPAPHTEPEPFATSPGPEAVDAFVRANKNYRHVFYTSKAGGHQQVAMHVSAFIPPEIHPDVDQYFLVKEGHGLAYIDGVFHDLKPLSSFWVERGQRHSIYATGGHALKLYVTYAGAHHPPGRVDSFNVDIGEWIASDDFA